MPSDRLDGLNQRLGQAVLTTAASSSGHRLRKVWFRPASVNRRTGPADVDLVVPTTLELGAELLAGHVH